MRMCDPRTQRRTYCSRKMTMSRAMLIGMACVACLAATASAGASGDVPLTSSGLAPLVEQVDLSAKASVHTATDTAGSAWSAALSGWSSALFAAEAAAEAQLEGVPRVRLALGVLLLLLVLRVSSKLLDTDERLVKAIMGAAISAAPGGQAALEAQLKPIVDEFDREFQAINDGLERIQAMPEESMSARGVLDDLQMLAKVNADKGQDPKKGRVSGTVYHGGDDLTEIIAEAYRLFALSNQLHVEVFPVVRKMDAEIIAMTASLFSGDAETCGVTTTGGTESIIMSMKAYRDRGKKERGISRPEVVVADSVHCAFNKAGDYLGIKIVSVPVGEHSRQLDLRAAAAAINSNTVAIVGSAPSYPHGVIDNIPELAKLALKHNIGLHVDACLGSFLVPFLGELGIEHPAFDFSVKGVSSMSVDTHKFGFAPKGNSVVLYKSAALRKHQYSLFPRWSGGMYCTAGMRGSQAGALTAGCWAALRYMGRDGYRHSAAAIVGARQRICAGVAKMQPGLGLKVMGNPQVSVIAFGNDGLRPLMVSAAMKKRGWDLNNLQRPESFHFCVTLPSSTDENVEAFLSDLKDSCHDVRTHPENYKGGAAAMYGTAASVPASVVENILDKYLDCTFRA